MPTLDAYIDFHVLLDFNSEEIVIRDTGTYPSGVNVDLTGIVNITQPDGVTVSGDWGSPDISWDGTRLTTAVKELRTTAQNKPQCGVYRVEYIIDHPSYSPTTLVKTFTLNIVYPEIDIVNEFDVFTPLLQVVDDTVYALNGFDAPTIQRNWAIDVGSVTTITSTATTVDLAYLGNYYDAVYTVAFTANVTQDHSTYTYLTVIYALAFNGTFNADTPPPLNDLVECLTELKALVDAQADADCCDTLEKKYGKAERRLSHLIHMLRVGITEGAFDLLEEFVTLTACDHGVHRNEIIQPYDISAYTGAGSDGDYYNYFLPSDLTEVELPALNGKVIKTIDMDGFGRVFSVGLNTDTPADGRFIVVTGPPKKFKYGGTMSEGQWLRIKYTNA